MRSIEPDYDECEVDGFGFYQTVQLAVQLQVLQTETRAGNSRVEVLYGKCSNDSEILVDYHACKAFIGRPD